VRVYEAKAAETVRCDARTLQIRKLYAPGIAYDHVLYISLAVYERAYLTARLVRELA
jgi:hypothetical protein